MGLKNVHKDVHRSTLYRNESLGNSHESILGGMKIHTVQDVHSPTNYRGPMGGWIGVMQVQTIFHPLSFKTQNTFVDRIFKASQILSHQFLHCPGIFLFHCTLF